MDSKNKQPQRFGIDHFNFQGLRGVLPVPLEDSPGWSCWRNYIKTVLRVYYISGTLLRTDITLCKTH